MGDDLTIEILKQIRDGVLATKGELKSEISGLRERLDIGMAGLKEEMSTLNVRMGRVEQGLLDLGKFMKQIAVDQTRHEKFHHQHVDVLEKDVEDLKERVRRLDEQDERKDA